jgi:hypothetical protein
VCVRSAQLIVIVYAKDPAPQAQPVTPTNQNVEEEAEEDSQVPSGVLQEGTAEQNASSTRKNKTPSPNSKGAERTGLTPRRGEENKTKGAGVGERSAATTKTSPKGKAKAKAKSKTVSRSSKGGSKGALLKMETEPFTTTIGSGPTCARVVI